jgi:hypothetical protein
VAGTYHEIRNPDSDRFDRQPGADCIPRFRADQLTAIYRLDDRLDDIDVLKTGSALRVNNLTEHNDSRAVKTDSKLGLSLIYGF